MTRAERRDFLANRLDKAFDAPFRRVIKAKLEKETRERVPLRWALTQSNLGRALCALGERESGCRFSLTSGFQSSRNALMAGNVYMDDRC